MAESNSKNRPNIIMIMTDQQRYDTIGALGYDYVDTPVLDRLANEGTVFTQCHVAAPTCAPSRGALFTGLYPHTSGILRNGSMWRHTWIENFTRAGYHTVNIGKMHTEPMDAPAGFSERFNIENKERYRAAPGVNRDYLDEWDRAFISHQIKRPGHEDYEKLPDFKERLGAFAWKLPEKLHSDVFTGDLAMWWLERKPKTEPLFLQIGFPGPHPPYDPTPEIAAPYLDRDLRIRPLHPADIDNQPEPFNYLRNMHTEFAPDSAGFDPQAPMKNRHRQRAHYLANQTMIDKKIGEILEKLRVLGYLENAIVVFTSDHGDCLGDHGLPQKWSCYEQVTRVPLIVWAPGRTAAGKKTDGLVQQQDLAQWLFEMAGLTVPETFETESISSAFTEDEFHGRDAVFAEQARDRYMNADMMTMVRTKNWKLVHFLGESFGQMFNLKEDPHEEADLWNDSALINKKRELIDRITEWHMYSRLKTSEWTREFR